MNTVCEWIRNSVLNRFFLFVAHLWAVWKSWYRESVLARFIGFFNRSYASSGAKRVISRVMTRKSDGAVTNASVWNRFLTRCERIAASAGAAFGRAWDASVFARACRAVSRYFHRSKIGGKICAVGMRRWLIIAFALYLPIDFAFREVLKIDILASLWDEAFLIFAALYVLYMRASRTKLQKSYTFATPMDGFIILFLAAHVFLALVVPNESAIAFDGWRAVCQYSLWFFVLIRLISDEKDFRLFYMAFAVSGVFMCLYACMQFVVGVAIPESWMTQTEQAVRTRVFGLTSSPNIMGTLTILISPMLVSLAYSAKETWQRVLAWGCAFVCLAACLFTFSRGAWLGMAVAVVVFALFSDKRLLAVIAAAIPAALSIPSVANRILFLFTSEYAAASAVGGRSVRWETGMNFFRRDPLLGFGLGRFGGAVAMQNQIEPTVNGFTYFYMDNYYLKLLVEGGLVSLCAFILVLAAIVFMGGRTAYRLRGTELGFKASSLLASLCGVMAHLYTENILEVPYMNAYFWGFAALLAWLGFIYPRIVSSRAKG